MDFGSFSIIPNDVLLIILDFSYTNGKSFINVISTCKRFKQLLCNKFLKSHSFKNIKEIIFHLDHGSGFLFAFDLSQNKQARDIFIFLREIYRKGHFYFYLYFYHDNQNNQNYLFFSKSGFTFKNTWCDVMFLIPIDCTFGKVDNVLQLCESYDFSGILSKILGLSKVIITKSRTYIQDKKGIYLQKLNNSSSNILLVSHMINAEQLSEQTKPLMQVKYGILIHKKQFLSILQFIKLGKNHHFDAKFELQYRNEQLIVYHHNGMFILDVKTIGNHKERIFSGELNKLYFKLFDFINRILNITDHIILKINNSGLEIRFKDQCEFYFII